MWHILTLAALVCSAHAIYVQQGSKLVGTGAVGSIVQQGSSVSLSSDGNTLASGGPYDNSNQGAVWVFVRSGGTWSQQGSKLVGSDGVGSPEHGSSVSLSSDGNTLASGGPGDTTGQGAVWVFTRSGGIWSQQGSKLVGSDGGGYSEQGSSLSLSSDGNTLALGGPYYNFGQGAGQGAIWVFTRSGGTWSQQGSKLVGTGMVGSYVYQGSSLSLSSDGNTLASGGHGDNSSEGAVWVFTRSNGTWSQQGSKLVGTGAVGKAYQGGSVSLSSDGNSLASGGHGDAFIGAVWVFTRSSGTWSQQGSKLVGTGAGGGGATQGNSVSLSSDGNTLASGGNEDNYDQGAVWIFTRSEETWSQQGSKLVGTGAVGSTVYQGVSVSLSSDGNVLASAGYNDNSSIGAVWVFWGAPTSAPSREPTHPTSSPSRSPTHPTSSPSRSPNIPNHAILFFESRLALQLIPVFWLGLALMVGCCAFAVDSSEYCEYNPEKISALFFFLPVLAVIVPIYFAVTFINDAIQTRQNRIKAIAAAAERARQAEEERIRQAKLADERAAERARQAEEERIRQAKLLALEQQQREEAYKNNAVQKATELGAGDLTNPYANVKNKLKALPNVMWLDISSKLDARVHEKLDKTLLLNSCPDREHACAISWRWVWDSSPEDTCTKILDMAQDRGYLYAWIDRCCLPQETVVMSKVIEASAVYDACHVIITSLSPDFDHDNSYVNRLWTSIELYRALARNPFTTGLGSIAPKQIDAIKFKFLFKHILDILEKGGLDLSRAQFGKLSSKEIDAILNDRFDAIVHESGNIIDLTMTTNPLNGLVRINFKPFEKYYRVGLVKSLDTLKCQKDVDRSVAAYLLLPDGSVLLDLAKHVLEQVPSTQMVKSLVLLETDQKLTMQQSQLIVADILNAKVELRLVGFRPGNANNESVILVAAMDAVFTITANGDVSLSTGEMPRDLKVDKELVITGPIKFNVSNTYRGYSITLPGAGTAFANIKLFPPVFVSSPAAATRFQNIGATITYERSTQCVPGYIPCDDVMAFLDHDRMGFILAVCFDAKVDVGLYLPAELSKVESDMLCYYLTQGPDAPFTYRGANQRIRGAVKQSEMADFVNGFVRSPTSRPEIFLGALFLQCPKSSNLNAADVAMMCRRMGLGDVAMTRVEAKCAVLCRFDLQWNISEEDAAEIVPRVNSISVLGLDPDDGLIVLNFAGMLGMSQGVRQPPRVGGQLQLAVSIGIESDDVEAPTAKIVRPQAVIHAAAKVRSSAEGSVQLIRYSGKVKAFTSMNSPKVPIANLLLKTYEVQRTPTGAYKFKGEGDEWRLMATVVE